MSKNSFQRRTTIRDYNGDGALRGRRAISCVWPARARRYAAAGQSALRCDQVLDPAPLAHSWLLARCSPLSLAAPVCAVADAVADACLRSECLRSGNYTARRMPKAVCAAFACAVPALTLSMRSTSWFTASMPQKDFIVSAPADRRPQRAATLSGRSLAAWRQHRCERGLACRKAG
jgi:hypothetical protein